MTERFRSWRRFSRFLLPDKPWRRAAEIAAVVAAALTGLGILIAVSVDGGSPSLVLGPSVTPGPSRSLEVPATDAVDIVKLTNGKGFVDVAVQVDAPPSRGTKYLLVAHFRGQFQLKGDVPSAVGPHTVRADVHLADPGSWRDFFVVAATPAAVKDWEASTENVLFAVPVGTKELTDWKPHQMPR